MKYSPSHKKEFIFGSFVYCYDLIKQDRKTLSLTVTPDLQICVKCPHKADDERVELFLKRKWFWLEKQLNFFGKYQRKVYKKEYVSGESFHYLGRQHQLVVKRSSENKVALLRGVLLVHTTRTVADGNYTKKLISEWHEERVNQIFNERFEEMKKRFDYKNMPRLGLRDMKRRWGSFVNNDKIILNPKLIHVSKDCIDYVIVHELCHMKYKIHDKKFFNFLYEKYPKWEKVKEKLEAMGALIQ
jgi:predicted metal-dependent hydrolase